MEKDSHIPSGAEKTADSEAGASETEGEKPEDGGPRTAEALGSPRRPGDREGSDEEGGSLTKAKDGSVKPAIGSPKLEPGGLGEISRVGRASSGANTPGKGETEIPADTAGKGPKPSAEELRERPKTEDRRVSVTRMLKIHLIIEKATKSDLKKLPSAGDLAKALEVSEDTINRDIKTMDQRLMLPLEYVPNRWGYRYTRPCKFPTLNVAKNEFFVIGILTQAVRAFPSASLSEGCRSILRKLHNELGDGVRYDLESIASVVSFRGLGFDRLDDLTLYHTLVMASLECAEMQFSYRSIGKTEGRVLQVRPLHVYCGDSALYLRADDVKTGLRTSYALVRMSDVVATGETFVRPADYDPDAEFDDCLGLFLGRKPEVVKLRLRGVRARVVQERTWHHSQCVTVQADGTVDLTMRVAVTPDLEELIRGWGSDVLVVEPVALKEKIEEEARKVATPSGWGTD